MVARSSQFQAGRRIPQEHKGYGMVVSAGEADLEIGSLWLLVHDDILDYIKEKLSSSNVSRASGSNTSGAAYSTMATAIDPVKLREGNAMDEMANLAAYNSDFNGIIPYTNGTTLQHDLSGKKRKGDV